MHNKEEKKMTNKIVNGMTVISPEEGMRLTDGETVAETFACASGMSL